MSRDIKNLTIDGVNDGLEKAIKRVKNNFSDELRNSEKRSIREATNKAMEIADKTRTDVLNRLQRVQFGMEQRIERIQRDLGARIDDHARETNQRLRDIDQRHTEALRRMSNQLFDAIEEQGNRMKKEVGRIDRNINILADGMEKLNGNMKELQREMDSRFDAQQDQINALDANVRTLFDLRKNEENEKILAAGAAIAVLEAVKERSPVKRFAPRYMQEEVALMERRLRNIKNDPSSCTISDANSLIDKSLVMENEALRAEAQWLAHFDQALKAADSILLMMSENIQVDSIYEGATDEEKIDLEANYWTHGAYDKLKNEVEQIKRRIESKEPDIDELIGLVDTLKQKEEQAAKMRIQAAELGILSETRVTVTNDILNAMLARGWELKDDPGYLGGEMQDEDMREGTFAVLEKKASGEELSVLILPEQQNGKTVNKIVFHRNDERTETQGAFLTRMEEIKRDIEKSGHKLGALGEPACGGDGKIPQLRNAQKLKKSGSAKEISAAMNRQHN